MFITFEGIEGSSKTTQASLLDEWLSSKGVDHLLTKEPGTVLSKECQQIRHLILSPDYDIGPRTELFLYLADRAQHVDKYIKPALKDGKWVISDRYADSTKVYQGIGRGLGVDTVTSLIDYASGKLMPDITFIMDLPAAVGVTRARSSNTEFAGGDRMERETLDFHSQLRKGFLALSKTHERYIVLNASKSIEELHEEVVKVLSKHVNDTLR